MTRRHAVAAFALVALAAASAGAAPSIPPISVSVPSGIAPLSVHFDATATTDPTSPRPFHSLDYQWSFGDPASGTWTHSSRSKNQATGAVAAHLYETPGTYQVTLTVRNPRGESATATTTVTVTDPSTVFPASATYCYANPGRDFAGCPRPCPSANCVTTSSVDDALAKRLAPGTRHYFRRGDTFAMTRTLFIARGGSPVFVAAFGSGPKPILATDFPRPMQPALSASSDWRVGQLKLTGTRGMALAGNGDALARVTFWDIDATGFEACHVVSGQGHDLIGVYDFTCTGMRPAARAGAWLILDHGDRSIYQGLRVEGAGSPKANGVFRTVGSTRSVLAHSLLQASHSQGVVSLRSCGAGSQPGCTAGMPNRFLQIADNRFVAASAVPLRTCTVNSCARSGDDGNDAVDFVWERNVLTLDRTGPTQGGFVWWIQGGDQTFRNNVIDVSGGEVKKATRILLEQFGPTRPGGGNRNNLHFVNNTIIATTPVPELIACGYTLSNGSGHQCRDNRIYAPQAAKTTIAEGTGWSESGNTLEKEPPR